MKLRASLILDAYEKQLGDIDADSLGIEDGARFERIQNLLIYLKSVKIIDPAILLKIFNLHRN